MQLKILIMLLLVVFLPVNVLGFYCYQEFATNMTVCGTGLEAYGGTYSKTGTYASRQDGALEYDGSYTTFALDGDGGTVAYMYNNYYRPNRPNNETVNLRGTIWQTQGANSSGGTVRTNITLASYCTGNSTTTFMLRAESNDEPSAGIGESYAYFSCWNGSLYLAQKSYGGCGTASTCARAYEEGIYWEINSRSNITVRCGVGGSDCLINGLDTGIETVKTCTNSSLALGNCNNTNVADGITWNVTEPAGVGFNATLTITNASLNLSSTIEIQTYAGYFFTAGMHYMTLRAWNYSSGSWYSIANLSGNSYSWITKSLLTSDFVNVNETKIMFIHPSSGAVSHPGLKVDYFGVHYGSNGSVLDIPYLPSLLNNISAVALPGYTFSNWTDDSSFCSVNNVTGNVTFANLTSGTCVITANFIGLPTYGNLSVISSNSTMGSVSGTNLSSNLLPVTLPINASPNSGYSFVNWTITSGMCSVANEFLSMTNVTLTMGDCNVTGYFQPITYYYLNTISDPLGKANTTGDMNTTSLPTTAQVCCTPNTGWSFSTWSSVGSCAPQNEIECTDVAWSSGNCTMTCVVTGADPPSGCDTSTIMSFKRNGYKYYFNCDWSVIYRKKVLFWWNE